ncbi:testis-expressed protein 29 [Phyllostomus hastatus]|uniref:testis-expressed protein 29 n=1 Tax=Phyllostomus hastatus TaxID=9423 RepID=UPI001E680A21|nr:testis-expressed protein 29 [Phyllostomus hastatus]
MRDASELKKSPSHPLKKFVVCNIPLYIVCDHNVSRDQCQGLGCCFRKGVCYEKAVPTHVQVFFALIVIITGAFIFTVIYKVVQERREKEVYRKLLLSSKPSGKAKAAHVGKQAAPKAWTGTAWKSDNCEESMEGVNKATGDMGASWSGAFSLVQSLRVEDFISTESSTQSALSDE